jgi:hypothetical protein
MRRLLVTVTATAVTVLIYAAPVLAATKYASG